MSPEDLAERVPGVAGERTTPEQSQEILRGGPGRPSGGRGCQKRSYLRRSDVDSKNPWSGSPTIATALPQGGMAGSRDNGARTRASRRPTHAFWRCSCDGWPKGQDRAARGGGTGKRSVSTYLGKSWEGRAPGVLTTEPTTPRSPSSPDKDAYGGVKSKNGA